MKIIKLKIIKNIPGYAAGTTASIQTDGNGIPINKFWRDRVEDAKTDNCVEILASKPLKPKKQESSNDS